MHLPYRNDRHRTPDDFELRLPARHWDGQGGRKVYGGRFCTRSADRVEERPRG